MPFHVPTRAAPRARSFIRSLALWIFGLSTTVLLIGMWGRSVASDEPTLAASVETVMESQVVHDRVNSWLAEGVAAAADTSPATVAESVGRITSSAEFDRAIALVVDQAVTAALAPQPVETTIDLAVALDSVVPVAVGELARDGIDVDSDAVRAGLETAPALVLSTDGLLISDTIRDARVLLTRVLVAGLAGMLASGAAALVLSPDRLRQVRGLAVRVGVSSLTFALILRVGSWAVDPDGGRSPIVNGSARLLTSNARVVEFFALGAAVAAVVATVAIRERRRRRGRASRLEDDPTPQASPAGGAPAEPESVLIAQR